MSQQIPIGDRVNTNNYDNTYGLDRQNPLPGSYRARVEYRADPLRLGRIKVRLPLLHGIPGVDEDALSVKDLPWARRKNKGSGGYDIGSFIVPPVGSWTWIEFEAGNDDRIVYTGGVDGRDSKTDHVMNIIDNYEEEDVPAGSWLAPLGENEIPKDVFEGKSDDELEPTREVLYKSLKGHTIMTDEEDEKESMSFIDRAGQVLRFLSPLKNNVNHSGDENFQRGTKDTVKGDNFDYQNDSVNSKAVIFMKDLATQVFRMVSEWTKEKIELISRSKEDKRRSVIKVAGGENDLVLLLLSEDDDMTNQTFIKFDPNNLNWIEKGVVVNDELVSREEMSVNQTSREVYNRPFKIEVYDTKGPSRDIGWSDDKDEEFIE